MQRIYLIRHGATRYNKERRYSGWTDISLSSTGRSDALFMKKKMSGISFDAIYSSPLKRAIETAKIVCPGKPLINTGEFKEMNFGDWEGKKFSEILKKYNLDYKNWMNNFIKKPVTHGESFEMFHKRVIKGFRKVLNETKDKKNILIVAHNGVVKSIVYDILQIPLKSFFKLKISNRQLVILEKYDSYITIGTITNYEL